ncbi:MAG: tetratricopeptide repeat protein [Cytophagales bacterium]|nr:tetratricopeptide repeat protein [Armatimonadota bacterium]
MENVWRVELLGSLQLRQGERVIAHFRSPKVGLLVAYLSLFRQQAHSREILAERLWPEFSPRAARNRLSQLIVWLRPLLEPETAAGGTPGSVLLADRTTVQLNFEAVTVDVHDFESRLLAAKRSDSLPPEAGVRDSRIGLLREALEIYHGDLVPGFHDDWILGERQRLADARIAALETLSRLYRARAQGRDLAAAAECARQAVAADETREEAHLELMRVLAASGQGAGALRRFREMERILASELSEKPSGEAILLAEQIRQQLMAGRGAPEGAPETGRQRSGNTRDLTLLAAPFPAEGMNFPLPLTRFFGRERELDQAARMMGRGARLITLLGTGGSGKTRLAIEIGRQRMADLQGAAAFVPLADLTDAALIPSAIAAALGMGVGETPPAPRSLQEDLIRMLSAAPNLLLILDNLEHLAGGGVQVLRRLLERVPGLTIIGTSRQRLGLQGEREMHVLPLPLPLPGESSLDQLAASPSIQLFVDRAQAVRPLFQLTAANAPTLIALCRHLEGLPLAIELCAAWSGILTPAQMRKQVEDRFALLVSRHEDLPDRHRTLRATIEYSYAQLPPDLKQAFVQLSVFRGGWTLEAAAALLEASPPARTLDALSRLRERSLIFAEEASEKASEKALDEAESPEMRYRMLETLREFAADQQTRSQARVLRRRHAVYFLRFAESLSPPAAGAMSAGLRRMEAEQDNLRAALQKCLDQKDTVQGLRLVQAIRPFWQRRGFIAEGAEWTARFLALPDAEGVPIRLRAQALNTQTEFLTSLADYSEALQAAETALALWQEIGDLKAIAFSFHLMAWPLSRLGETARAHDAYTRRLEIAEVLGDTAGAASSVTNRAQIYFGDKQWAKAHGELQRSLEIHRTVGSPRNVAVTLNSLGLVARHQQNYPAARRYFEESLALMRDLGDTVGQAIGLVNLATVHRLTHELETADHLLREALRLAAATAERYVTAWCLKELGHLACAEENYHQGIYLLGVADALRYLLGITFKPADPEELEQDKRIAARTLGYPLVQRNWERGQEADTGRIVMALQNRTISENNAPNRED